MSETCKEFTERIWGRELTDKEVELLLWHCTAFPCLDPEPLEKQLIEVRDKSGGDIDTACRQASEEMTEAMANPIEDK